MKHKHGKGPWLDGGPRRMDLRRVVRDRFCNVKSCQCDDVCCWESDQFRLDKQGHVAKRIKVKEI